LISNSEAGLAILKRWTSVPTSAPHAAHPWAIIKSGI